MAETSSAHDRRLIFIELNEINFDIVRSYLENKPLPAFRSLLSGFWVRTTAEQRYELLEPWIQWPSVHTGLSACEHSVLRLGDIVNCRAPQIFEQLEKQGLRIGCIAVMNAENRLGDSAYFIPDPWTDTPPDKSWWSRVLTAALSQAVNDNAKRHITARSALCLLLGLVRFAQPRHYAAYVRLLLRSGRRATWRKALALDLLLHDIHLRLFAARRPHYSTLFLNAGAHIQHHYLFNSPAVRAQSTLRNPAWYVREQADPVAEMLQVYDAILGEYLAVPNVDVIVATGLSQRPYDRVKFYYRLKDHAAFLRGLGVRFRSVLPRMTRDFLIQCDSMAQAESVQQRLASVTAGGEALFGEIDNRGKDLFVTLTYPREVTETVTFEVVGRSERLSPHVVFVAVKNGMHQDVGFAFFTPNVSRFAPVDRGHVKELHATVERYFSATSAG
jgi:hypothetical protein